MVNLELPGVPPIPKKRGRPATGKAKTAAERKAKQRRLAVSRIYSATTGELQSVPLTSLFEELQRAMSQGFKHSAERICAELARRVAAIPDQG